jgi:hypothetical protein
MVNGYLKLGEHRFFQQTHCQNACWKSPNIRLGILAMRANADLRAGETGEISEDWQRWGGFLKRVAYEFCGLLICDRFENECVDSPRLPLLGDLVTAVLIPNHYTAGTIPSLFGDLIAVVDHLFWGYCFRCWPHRPRGRCGQHRSQSDLRGGTAFSKTVPRGVPWPLVIHSQPVSNG